MNKLNEKIKELIQTAKDELPHNVVAVNIFFNSDDYEIKTTSRTADQLRKSGISMRNIKGEWIK